MTTPLLMCMHSMLVHGYVCMHTGTHVYIYYTHTIIKWGKIVKKYPVLLTLTPNKITNSSLVTAHTQLIFKLFRLSPTFSEEVDLCKLGPQPTLCVWPLSHRGPLFPGHVGVLFFLVGRASPTAWVTLLSTRARLILYSICIQGGQSREPPLSIQPGSAIESVISTRPLLS